MASLVAENWVCINSADDSSVVEISKFNSALLMSLLEEPHGDQEYNDDQLNRIIQSLEAEISEQRMLEDHDVVIELPEFLGDDENGHNCLASIDFGWAGNMEQVPSSPSDDMNWILDHCEYELDDMVEFECEAVSDYSDQIYNVCPSEEHGFSSLWHETYIR